MRITLVGSRHFGVTTFDTLRQHGVQIVRVVVAQADDRLAAAARAAGIEVTVQASPKLVGPQEIADGTDLIVTAHSHARIAGELTSNVDPRILTAWLRIPGVADEYCDFGNRRNR